VTFKDLQKVIESQPGQGLNNNQLQRLRNSGFWYWDQRRHKERDRLTKGDCCMQHIIGPPKKDGKEMPIFEYERQLYRALVEPGYLNSYPRSKPDSHYSTSSTSNANVWYPFKEKHLWIKKTTGIGITEFMLRFMAWLCVRTGKKIPLAEGSDDPHRCAE
jgi:hypothetical protein